MTAVPNDVFFELHLLHQEIIRRLERIEANAFSAVKPKFGRRGKKGPDCDLRILTENNLFFGAGGGT